MSNEHESMRNQRHNTKKMQSLSTEKMFRKRSNRLIENDFLVFSSLGMRADWILTDEERVNKKLKIEENRRLRRLLYPNSSDSDEVRNRGRIDEFHFDLFFRIKLK